MLDRKTRCFRWLATLAIVWVSLFTGMASAEDPDASALIKKMSAEISGLNTFILHGELYSDARLEAGQIIEHASTATLRVRRPNVMRLTIRTRESVKELHFAEGELTFYNDLNNFYAQTKAPGDIAATADFAVNKVGIDTPMLDFLSDSLAARLQENAQEVQYLGQSLMRGQHYHHIAIRLPEIDVQIWVASKGKPLPGKMVISSKWEGGAPRTVMFFDWDTAPQFRSGSLEFVPPEGASEIEFLLDP